MRRLITLLLCLVTVWMSWGQDVKSEKIISIDGAKYYLHTVLPKETLYSLSRAYNLAVEEIRASNSGTDALKIGDVIKIPYRDGDSVTVSGSFKKHRVEKEDTLYSIARRYGVSVDILIADNPGIDITALKIGSRLNIRKNAIGDTAGSHIGRQIENYAQNISDVSDKYVLHVAVVGETLYSLSRKYDVDIQKIAELNGLQGGIVKAGAMIKIPKKVVVEQDAVEQTEEEMSFSENDVAIERYVGGEMNIAMLLPLTEQTSIKVRGSFIEFYQGALLALEDLKNQGYSIQFNLYDTQNSLQKVEDIVDNDGDFQKSNLIIGPVYERNGEAVVQFARRRGVVMVSPLANVNDGYGNMFYQLSPAIEYKNDKLKEYLSEQKHIIFISAGTKDEALEREMLELIGDLPHKTLVYKEGVALEEHLALNKENVYVVTSANETDTDKVLAAISSMHNNRVARSMNDAPIKVIGNSRWLRYNNIEKNLFFKLNVSLVTSYHADISNQTIKAFDGRYLQAFGDFPTLYSYRGYDAVRLFAEAYLQSRNKDISDTLNNRVSAPLQVPYQFVFKDGKYVNTQWTLLDYNGDYTIVIR